MVIDSNFFMNLAIDEAWKYQGLTYPNPAVGCCIVGKHGELLAIEAHKKAGEAHAEVNALKSAFIKLTKNEVIKKLYTSQDIHNFLLKYHNNCFKNISIFTTLEPCSHVGKTPSCASLISKLGIKKLYVGSLDTNKEASGGNEIIKKNNVKIITGILKNRCDELIEPFNLWQKDKFVFFKWAQRLDGSTNAGVISTLDSRKNVHMMRNVCDLLIIGGNTVRVDRPTLDARLVDGKAPDILIYSTQKNFDRDIALFKVKNRKVIISDDLSIIHNYKNIMIEGTQKMFELTKYLVNYHLCYLHLGDKFKILNTKKEDEDIIMWMKNKDL